MKIIPKTLSFVSAGYGSASILAFIFYFAFAKILGVEEYGQFIYLFSISSVLSIVARFGLGSTTTVQLAKGNHDFASQAIALSVIISAIFSALVFFVNPYLAILTFATSIFMAEHNVLLGNKLYKKYFIIQVMNRIFQIIISLVLYYLLGISGILLGSAIVCLASAPDIYKLFTRWNFRFDQIRKRIAVIVQNFGVESGQLMSPWIDKILLMPLFGLAVIGTYQFSYQILLGLGIVPMIIYNYLLPEESSKTSNNRSVIFIGIIVSVILFFVTFFFSPELVRYFFPQFVGSIEGIQIMSFGSVPLAVISIIQAKLQSSDSKLVGGSAIVRIASHLALMPVLWNIFEINGLALAAIISIFLQMFYLVIIYLRKT